MGIVSLIGVVWDTRLPLRWEQRVKVSVRVSFEERSFSELKTLTHCTYSTISRLNLFFSFIPAALTITLIA